CPVPRAPSVGFTLVELLIVIAILGILMSLVTAGAQTARRRGAVAKAKATIAALETAIAMYHADLGSYPASGNAELVAALTEEPDDANWQGPYMELKQDEVVNGELVDPWGSPYLYESVNEGSPTHRTQSYDLFSVGPNGSDDGGTQDDLVNW
ncbi:MAG: type II secretion system major pseudopilin GspG, partial [Candidatus Omnitrophica bacterium]|nr:type II secretion system major pseudopilin GspG [Candidatus Omnitrophota bacterium]